MCSQSTIQRHKDTLAKNRAELLQWPGLTSGVYYSGNLIPSAQSVTIWTPLKLSSASSGSPPSPTLLSTIRFSLKCVTSAT